MVLAAAISLAGGLAYYQITSKPDDVKLLVNRLAIIYWLFASIVIGIATLIVERTSLDTAMAVYITIGTAMTSIIASHVVIEHFRRRRRRVGGQRNLERLQERLGG